MRSSDKFYIDLANKVHTLVSDWDPLGIVCADGFSDDYDSLEKRFLSSVINSEKEEITVSKIKKNLEFYGIEISSIEDQVEKEVKKILLKLKKDL